MDGGLCMNVPRLNSVDNVYTDPRQMGLASAHMAACRFPPGSSLDYVVKVGFAVRDRHDLLYPSPRAPFPHVEP